MPIKSGTSDVKKTIRKSATLYGNLQENADDNEKAAQATQKKAAQANASPMALAKYLYWTGTCRVEQKQNRKCAHAHTHIYRWMSIYYLRSNG